MTDTHRLPLGVPAVARSALAMALLAMAAACDTANPAATAQVGRGTDVVVAAAAEGGSVALDSQLPDVAPLFPGARVVSRISGIDGAGAGSVVVMEADAPFADVLAFYDRAAAKAGTAPAMRVDKDGKAIRMFRSNGEKDGGTILVIEHGSGDRRTRMVLTTGVSDLGIEVPRLSVVGPPPPPAGRAPDQTAERRAPAADVRLQ